MAKPMPVEIQLMDGPLPPAPPLIGGGVVQFVGRTRSETHPEYGALLHLQYEAHAALAMSELHRISSAAQDQWPLQAIRIRHATGPVAPGQASVDIEVAAAHRDEAFAACRWLIDTLKQQVPIWKHEVWTSGRTWAAGTPVAKS